ncbi:hypothetical protein [Senegalia massiliensis]|uniref:Uncharacterized protein n=1 Tax=Senegalia massiliensis TaxID=1720316 RepID=A0A845R300_9CLOT|nr:hypothetical protein [Senegalia massiliensis]NBI08339.1 hypothetical protein [Senegalia massiliensis]
MNLKTKNKESLYALLYKIILIAIIALYNSNNPKAIMFTKLTVPLHNIYLSIISLNNNNSFKSKIFDLVLIPLSSTIVISLILEFY